MNRKTLAILIGAIEIAVTLPVVLLFLNKTIGVVAFAAILAIICLLTSIAMIAVIRKFPPQ
jgi:hypothetical protein